MLTAYVVSRIGSGEKSFSRNFLEFESKIYLRVQRKTSSPALTGRFAKAFAEERKLPSPGAAPSCWRGQTVAGWCGRVSQATRKRWECDLQVLGSGDQA